MEVLNHILSNLFSNTVPFIILLGALIFVHELGHFLVAKYYQVRVEVFSLGFGKKILQYKYGDTIYCLSLIPLGGYVKLYGDDPRMEVPPEQQAVSFLHKPLRARTAVVLAGPLMNFIFAIFVFTIVALLGDFQVEPIIGDIAEDSVAYRAGLRPGDKLIAINGTKLKSWKQFTDYLEDRHGQNLRLSIQRASGEINELVITPELKENTELLSTKSFVGTLPGITNVSRSTAIGITSDQSLAAQSGLRTHDIIKKINGVSVNTWRELIATVKSLKGSEILNFEVERYSEEASEPKLLTFTVPLSKAKKNSSGTLMALGIETAELYLSRVIPDSPAQKAGLQANDRIVSINGIKFSRWMEVLETIRAYKTHLGALKFVVMRNNSPIELEIKPELTQQQGPQGQHEQRFTVGIAPTYSLDVVPPSTIVKAESFSEALKIGWSQTIWWTQATFAVFGKIFSQKISPRNIGGIISIHQAAKRTFDYGISVFVKMMGILSVNLFVMNLLPIPVLDGGHLFFYFIELIKGAPLSVRKMEIATQVGLFLLIGLMLFAIFNDINNVFHLNW